MSFLMGGVAMSNVMEARIPNVRNQVSEDEWKVRIDLAASYRLVALYGWDDLIFTHISARVPGVQDHFLINPYGMLFEEVTASNLVKVDFDGKIVMETPYQINPAGFTIHSAVHAVRHDAQCVMHTHSAYGVAVSAQRDGLRRLSQQALFPLSSISYHDYEGLALNDDEKPRLQADLGDKNYMLLRNHGLLTLGQTVADAFLGMYILERACRVQILAQSAGAELIEVPEPILKGITAQVELVLRGMGGQLAWPALLRKLDRIDPAFRS
jgi:ribulose-5-phosphate 4-epimerase/fuculose-1-phosphate aldolase